MVEVGDAISTAVAGWVLRALGASVTRIDLMDPRSGSTCPAARSESSPQLIQDLLYADTASVTATGASIYELLGEADLVLFDTSHGWPLAEGSATVAEYLERVRYAGAPAWVTISPFGLSGPLAGQPADELVTLAASGLLHYTRGCAGEYVVPAGFQAGVATGHVAALAAIDALSQHAATGQPVHLEVSAQEAVVATSVVLEVAHVLYGLDGEPGTGRYGPPRGLLACGDGHVYLSILEDHHWRRLRAALGEPGWAAGIEDLSAARSDGPKIMAQLTQWAASLNRDELVSVLQDGGVPATAVYSCWELLVDRGYRDRGFFGLRGRTDGPTLPEVPFLYRSRDDTQQRNARDATARPLRSLRGRRVADLSNVLAGPLATSWLGAMGADVVRLEEVQRADIYRRRGPRPPQPWPPAHALELSGYFGVANHSKRSVTPASEDDAEVRERLLAGADVVVENLSAHRRSLLGLDFDTFRRHNQNSVLISSSGFGRIGSRAHYRVFGTNLHCHSGIVYHTRDDAGRVCNIGAAAWADPITSIWVALLAASACVGDIDGADFDISMAEVASRHLFDHFAIAATVAEPPGQQQPPIPTSRPPHAVLATDDGSVMVVAATARDWATLQHWRPRLAAASGAEAPWYEAASAALSRLAQERFPGRAAELAAALRANGVRAHAVLDADGLARDPHLAARGFFTPVSHPVWGKQRVVGMPWRTAGGGPTGLGPTPLLGQHDQSWRDDRQWDG